MRAVTQAFLDALRGPHKMVSRAAVVAPFQTGTSPISVVNTTSPATNPGNTYIPISGGSITDDTTADIQGSLDLSTDGSWPGNSSGLLVPYGNELYVECGVQYGNGFTEWVGQGYFKMYVCAQPDAPDGPITVTAYDRMRAVQDFKPIAPQQFLPGSSVQACITSVVQAALPGVPVDFDFADTTFAVSHILDSDRLAFLQDVVSSLGKIMFFDYRGRLQVMSLPSTTAPVWEVNGGPSGVLSSLSRSTTREGMFNVCVASGGPAGGNAVSGVWADFNPASPTYYLGPFGVVTQYYTSNFLAQPDQCIAAARAQIALRSGLPYQVDFNATPNYALVGHDCVLVTYDHGRQSELHTLDKITTPLTAAGGTMSASTRVSVFK